MNIPRRSMTDRFNPILVREARQMVRSRWIVMMILLYLILLLAFVISFALIFDTAGPEDSQERTIFLFGATLGSTTFATLLTVVVHTVSRLTFDRIHEDLSFYSTLTPDQHVRGRLVCGVVISLLFFSIAGPFLAASYLFRGLDIWVYFVAVPIPFVLIQLVNILVLAVFSPVRTPVQLIFYGALAMGIAFAFFGLGILYMQYIGADLVGEWRTWFSYLPMPTILLTHIILPVLLAVGLALMPAVGLAMTKRRAQRKGISFSYRRWFFRTFVLALECPAFVLAVLALLQHFGVPVWQTVFLSYGVIHVWREEWFTLLTTLATLFLILFILPVTAYLFARCGMSPYSENRMRPIRVWLTKLIVLFSFVTLLLSVFAPEHYFGNYYYRSNAFTIWVPTIVGIFSAMLVMAVCERETWEGRLRRDIPESKIRRALVFPFYTGSINALCWVFLGTFFLIAVVCLSIVFSSKNDIEQIMWSFPFMIAQMYVFDCSMTAFWLWKRFGQRILHRQMIWVLTLTLFVGLWFGAFFLLEPVLHVDSFLIGQILVGAIILWFFATIVLGYPWLRNRFLDFTPDEKNH